MSQVTKDKEKAAEPIVFLRAPPAELIRLLSSRTRGKESQQLIIPDNAIKICIFSTNSTTETQTSADVEHIHPACNVSGGR